MKIYDAKSYTSGSFAGGAVAGDLWNYGVETWCNMEGQYVTIVADLADLSGHAYEMTICSLGIMGVEYVRATPAPTSEDITNNGEKTILIDNIYAA